MGLEAQPPTPGLQNVTLYPYVNPATELIDATNLPTAGVKLSAGGLPDGDVKVTPISSASDGTQIWRFTHNGVDTHPIHFHLYDVQVLNRVTWDNIILPTEPSELGWKDTVRMSPLEDTIVALRPIIPKVPFEVPNAIRNLNPMMPTGSRAMFNNVDPQGNPATPIVNKLVNFGWEYVIHCHILSHEEMDMMRPVSVAVPPQRPDGLTSAVVGNGGNARIRLTWRDNSITETSFLVQRTTDGTTWVDVGTVASPLDQPNTHQTRTFTDTTMNATTPRQYRVVALNAVGYGGAHPALTVRSVSPALGVNAPAAPTALTATLQAGPRVSLSWRDNATNETGFVVERATNGGAFSVIASPAARGGTGTVTLVDSAVLLGNSYAYRVRAVNVAGASTDSNTATLMVAVPTAPVISTGTAVRQGSNERLTLTWADLGNESSYTIQWSTTAAFTSVSGSGTAAANATSFTTGTIARQTWYVRIRANNALGSSTWSTTTVAPAP
nr:multicopper oxidase domain-containing protein [Tessaracoccus sp. SD287]